MPLLEGKIDCADCHQPHGSVNDPLLLGASEFDLCTSCHADKRGPFIWEHAPATEGWPNRKGVLVGGGLSQPAK